MTPTGCAYCGDPYCEGATDPAACPYNGDPANSEIAAKAAMRAGATGMSSSCNSSRKERCRHGDTR